MVKVKNEVNGVHTTYYLKPGQTLKNTKPSERALALIVPRSVYDGYYEQARESERVAFLAEQEAKRLAALKQATYNMSKSWEDTAQNIQRRRRQELLNRRKIEEAERMKFTKEMAKKNAEERAVVVKHAKELLLYRKPQCRRINKALLISECYKEVDAQVEARKSKNDRLAKLAAEEAQALRDDVEKFQMEEKKKREERMNALKLYKKELEKQIQENERNLKSLEEALRKSETEDMQNMSKELEELKKKEIQETLEKKERLNKMFLNAIREKKRHELKIQQEDEFQANTLKLYTDFKLDVEKTAKERKLIAREQKCQKTIILGKKFAEFAKKKHESAELEDAKKEKLEKEMEERRRLEAEEIRRKEKEKREKARHEMQQDIKKAEEELKLRKKEEEDLKLWETLQRYKCDEFNKEWNLQKREEEKNKRLNYGKILKKQMRQDQSRRRHAKLEEDNSKIIKDTIQKENEKVLGFGEKILQESEGVRPIYPIVKVIEEFKKEIGLKPSTRLESDTQLVKSMRKRKQGRRRFVCPPLDENKAFYFA